MGHALIINNVEKELKGSAVDAQALASSFKTIGFQVRVEKNCTKLVSCFFFSLYYSSVKVQ